MMYRIDIEITEAHFKELCLDAGADQREVEETEFHISLSHDCKDAEEVLGKLPHLLDMISEGKVTSIKITEL